MTIDFKYTLFSQLEKTTWLFIGLIIIWLFWSASILGIETGDGYLTLATSQHFLGLNETYGFQRGPFLAFYLIPAEWIANSIGLHPLDLRPHHIMTAFLHSIYICFIWLILTRFYDKFDKFVAIAFLATIPSFIFFSYAIFISPDIFPGLILIAMILLAAKADKQSSIYIWSSLVILGFIATLFKQTYAIFWITILVSCLFFYSRKTNFFLFTAASFSALLSWLTYAWFLQDAISPDIQWWIKPAYQIIIVANQFSSYSSEALNKIFLPSLYIQNLYNYGLLTSILILPSIAYVLFFDKSNNKTLKIISINWILIFLFLQFITYKEVRYLIPLAPLSAFILVPFLRFSEHSKFRVLFLSLITILLIFDISKGVSESLRVKHNFYQTMTSEYLQPINTFFENRNTQNKNKIIMINELGFTPNIYSPLKFDRFHRTFHLSKSVLPLLYGFDNDVFFSYGANDAISHEAFSAGDLILFSNEQVIREPPWDPLNRVSFHKNFTQIIGIAEKLTLSKAGDNFVITTGSNDEKPLMLLNNKHHRLRALLGYNTFRTRDLATIIDKQTLSGDTIELIGFRILRSCNGSGCFDMINNGSAMF